jgi:hypothetical protein
MKITVKIDDYKYFYFIFDSVDPTITDNLIELKPPKHVYPQGNVGTPTSYFLNEINACRLPSTIISKYRF